ncbi:hypothetical protein SH661x_001031 [Planctomicrobium sp. SH661]|uniref:hypothetical protein n=1 Tax=Planctomicrobium sp. SH661 TaxID=3448124 RepID=UPI003F5C41FC
MTPRPDDLATLQAQLAEKNDLVAALTAQLEKSAIQLDRLTRAGAERSGHAGSGSQSGIPAEYVEKLSTVLDDWQEFQPAERVQRIESGIDRILELLSRQPVAVPAAKVESSQKAAATEDFWEAAKARILGDEPAPASPQPPEEVQSNSSSTVLAEPINLEQDDFNEIGAAPDLPSPVTATSDSEELMLGVKTRDVYIQYLTSRLRLAESRKYVPVNWDLLAEAPDNYRRRLESLETLLKDHLRQAEVALSLERAMLARERAKLAQIKQNLELQIKKMVPVSAMTLPPASPVPAPPPQVPESKPDPEGRWKRIFSR